MELSFKSHPFAVLFFCHFPCPFLYSLLFSGLEDKSEILCIYSVSKRREMQGALNHTGPWALYIGERRTQQAATRRSAINQLGMSPPPQVLYSRHELPSQRGRIRLLGPGLSLLIAGLFRLSVLRNSSCDVVIS